MADETDINAELTDETLCFVFANGLGVALTTDTPDAPMSRGDLADLFFQLFAE